MLKIINNAQTWRLSIDEFENGHYGKQRSRFQVHPDYKRKFTTNGTYHKQDAFDSLANKVIQAMSSFTIFNEIEMDWTIDEIRKEVRYAVYQGMQHKIMNNDYEVRTKPREISGSNMSRSAIPTQNVFLIDNFGSDAVYTLLNSGIFNYSVVTIEDDKGIQYSSELTKNDVVMGEIKDNHLGEIPVINP